MRPDKLKSDGARVRRCPVCERMIGSGETDCQACRNARIWPPCRNCRLSLITGQLICPKCKHDNAGPTPSGSECEVTPIRTPAETTKQGPLIACKGCSKEVPRFAKKCPECGFDRLLTTNTETQTESLSASTICAWFWIAMLSVATATMLIVRITLSDGCMFCGSDLTSTAQYVPSGPGISGESATVCGSHRGFLPDRMSAFGSAVFFYFPHLIIQIVMVLILLPGAPIAVRGSGSLSDKWYLSAGATFLYMQFTNGLFFATAFSWPLYGFFLLIAFVILLWGMREADYLDHFLYRP
jgi:hypothetical protein